MICNRSEWRQFSGMSDREFDAAVRDGLPVVERPDSRGRDWKINSVRAMAWVIERAVAEAGGAGGDDIDLTAERARLTKAQADLAEMEAAVRRGELIAAKPLKSALAQRDIAIKDRLLAVPMAGAHRAVEAAEKTGVNGVAEVYEREIHAALSDLASATLVSGAERRG
jgi:phage terminase Nu1 subunit (DNA packaging protein)